MHICLGFLSPEFECLHRDLATIPAVPAFPPLPFLLALASWPWRRDQVLLFVEPLWKAGSNKGQNMGLS